MKLQDCAAWGTLRVDGTWHRRRWHGGLCLIDDKGTAAGRCKRVIVVRLWWDVCALDIIVFNWWFACLVLGKILHESK